MYYKTLFLLILLLCFGCAVVPKTEVGKFPPSERVIFYSDSGIENKVACVNFYKLIIESLAGKEAEQIVKGFISEGEKTLNQMRNEINVLDVLTKLQNKIEETDGTSKEGKENDNLKQIKENYPQLYSKLKKELQERRFNSKDEKIEQIKKEYLAFYQQFSLDMQALNYDLLKERREEIVSIIDRLGRKAKFRKIIDSSYGNDSGCQFDTTKEFMHIYDKMVENNYRDSRFYPHSKKRTWEVLISFLKSSGYIIHTMDKKKGIIKTQAKYFKPSARNKVEHTSAHLMEKDSTQLDINEYINQVAYTPAEKQGSWFTTRESLTIQVIPFSRTLTKVKVKLTIEACSDSEGWEVLISNKFTERSILDAIEEELLIEQRTSNFNNIPSVHSCDRPSLECSNL